MLFKPPYLSCTPMFRMMCFGRRADVHPCTVLRSAAKHPLNCERLSGLAQYCSSQMSSSIHKYKPSLRSLAMLLQRKANRRQGIQVHSKSAEETRHRTPLRCVIWRFTLHKVCLQRGRSLPFTAVYSKCLLPDWARRKNFCAGKR